MKKTLIALVVASSAVSGSAMAAGWEENGSGSSVELGGTLTPTTMETPWEVKTGNAVTDLNAQIQKGQRVVNISTNESIPVLGIRTKQNTAFNGQQGITPQIDYQGKVTFSESSNWGESLVNLDIFDNSSNKIGSL
ncbi:hypothetical protein PX578_004419, partial [Escherichia coli]|nr:hypothetical protein [Escherichia coli]